MPVPVRRFLVTLVALVVLPSAARHGMASALAHARPVAAAQRPGDGRAAADADAGREGAWRPPSQNAAQRRGGVFAVRDPGDLLDFASEDDRLAVVKVYASWCKTCRQFDLRYRKLAATLGDAYDAETGTDVVRRGRVRFAEIRYDDADNAELCRLLGADGFPYLLLYKGRRGKVADFRCTPATFQLLLDAVDEHADPEESGGDAGDPRDGTPYHVPYLRALGP